ncbi:MAG: hypothetical protein LC121_25070 [Anaerolineae bacterium]|nr:hypothetical protein [Anaerolineae bacterium]
MSKPKGRAFRTERATDGIVTLTRWRLDRGSISAADRKAIERTMHAGSPEGRIEALERNLRTLSTAAPPVAHMHAAEIRKRLDELNHLRGGLDATRDELRRLSEAEQLWAKVMLVRDVMPLARRGAKFQPGRKGGAVGPIRKAITTALKRDPTLTNDELWERVKAHPPRGWRAVESTRLGRYFAGPRASDSTSYARFRNIAAEERGKLKSA